MAAYPFLSPEWIEAAQALRTELAAEIAAKYPDQATEPPMEVKANVIVTDAPFAESTIEGHVDTSGGALTIENGHLDDPELTVELPYSVAKSLFVDRDPQAAMQSFMEGKIKVTGDVSKILAIQPPKPGGEENAMAGEIIRRLDEITE